MKTNEQRVIDAADARDLMNNKFLKSAFEAVGRYLDDQALSCPQDPDKALRIVQGKQILAGIKREIQRIIDDGVVAEIQIVEIEKKRRKPIFAR